MEELEVNDFKQEIFYFFNIQVSVFCIVFCGIGLCIVNVG